MILDFSMVRNVGGDEGFSLKTELHETRRIRLKQSNQFVMKNGMSVDLTAMFFENPEEVGPSDQVQFEGFIKNEEGKIIKKAEGKDYLLKINEPKRISFDSEGKTIDLSLVLKVEKR